MKKNILYHYTSIAGLNGIIQSYSIWASDCRFLNDSQELKFAIQEFVDKYSGEAHDALDMALGFHILYKYPCVFSLSSSPKVLSQWRAYADDGRGAAIGFNADSFKYPVGSSPVQCVYSNHDQFLKNIMTQCSDEVDEIVSMYKRHGASTVLIGAYHENAGPIETILGELLRIKNPAFAEEKEFRLIVQAEQKAMKTRIASNLIVPFIELPLLDSDEGRDDFWCVAPEIWMGPKCDKRNEDAIRAFNQFGWMPTMGLHRFDCGYI